MPDATVLPLTAWNSFYVIIGSAAAALTGLMFVAVSLIPASRVATTGESLSAFGTPTVVHFCAALLVSAIFCAPWAAVEQAGLAAGAVGIAGAAYVLVVIRRARRQHEYRPEFSDWLWHMISPFVIYSVLAASSVAISATGALFVTGAATIGLLFIGIRNAWDTVTFIAIDRIQGGGGTRSDAGAVAGPQADGTSERQAD
jgi:hypothetical protein